MTRINSRSLSLQLASPKSPRCFELGKESTEDPSNTWLNTLQLFSTQRYTRRQEQAHEIPFHPYINNAGNACGLNTQCSEKRNPKAQGYLVLGSLSSNYLGLALQSRVSPSSLTGELERRSYPSIPHPHSSSISPPSFTKCAIIPTFITPLPPENDHGSIEYKLRLLLPFPARFTRLVTQLKWRLLEGGGRALYELGVGDDGELVCLDRKDMEETIGVLSQMAGELGARVWVLRQIRLGRVRQIRLGRVEGMRTVARDISQRSTISKDDPLRKDAVSLSN
ncbi:hypothetical protein EV360DRAFT_89892 [Lentinula raphanica]|nr:hypothetical protein EV360DRAFT_89892 [Lentinula raphanica]